MSLDLLKQASVEALSGSADHNGDAFRAWGVNPEEAIAFVEAWVGELADRAEEFEQPVNDYEFVRSIALGMLSVGIAFGRKHAPKAVAR